MIERDILRQAMRKRVRVGDSCDSCDKFYINGPKRRVIVVDPPTGEREAEISVRFECMTHEQV